MILTAQIIDCHRFTHGHFCEDIFHKRHTAGIDPLQSRSILELLRVGSSRGLHEWSLQE